MCDGGDRGAVERLLRALGRFDYPPEVRAHLEVLADVRLRERGNRIAARAAINAALGAILATRPREEWMQALAAERLPFAPVNTLAEALADPPGGGARHGGPHTVAGRRHLPGVRQPDQAVRRRPRHLHAAADARAAHPGGAGRRAGLRRSADRRLLASGAFAAATDRHAPGHDPPAGSGGARTGTAGERTVARPEAGADHGTAIAGETAMGASVAGPPEPPRGAATGPGAGA